MRVEGGVRIETGMVDESSGKDRRRGKVQFMLISFSSLFRSPKKLVNNFSIFVSSFFAAVFSVRCLLLNA